MRGMAASLSRNDPTIVSAFHHALDRQALVVVLVLFLVAVAWNVTRSWTQTAGAMGVGVGDTEPCDPSYPADATAAAAAQDPSPPARPEPAGRRLLRIGFGLLWVFDGILQAQSSIPMGMIPQVVQPAANGSPGWVQHLVDRASHIWSYHPVTAASASVWIQVGLGLWLLVAPRGRWSRWGGGAALAWAVVVWVFGEALGGVLAPGLSWLFGAPGAVVFYAAAGGLIALPERRWSGPALGRRVLAALGLFFVGMALLQAWPGRGFWQGRSPGGLGPVAEMARQMARTPQPHPLSAVLSGFSGLAAAHGWGLNLFVVAALGLVGVGFLVRDRRMLTAAVVAATLLCLADWVLVQDLGFWGGVGTDPNSMIPMVLVLVSGWLGLAPLRVAAEAGAEGAVATAPVPPPAVPAGPDRPGTLRQRVRARPAYTFRAVAALGAAVIVLLGAAPMAVATTEPNADPILAQAVDGAPQTVNFSAPSFSLVDQAGRRVTSAGLRGKVVALTFLDPVCTSDCPIIAQEFRGAAALLGAQGRNVELVAIDANPSDLNPEYLRVFDQVEHLDRQPNWLYLTGTLAQLRAVWTAYGIDVEYDSGGSMIGHTDAGFVIDRSGHVRYVLSTDPGPGNGASSSSFSVTLAQSLRQVLSGSR
jgi:cytochrome oxidase Cu insertion factor (SCO1/SenC/PrrC family)